MTPLRVGIADKLADGVHRLLAPNAGVMTGPGTNTYFLGETELAVIDPGPLRDDHIDAIASFADGRLRWILVTHTHPDHSPAAKKLADMTGAQLLGQVAPGGRHQDSSFKPTRTLEDGDSLTTKEFSVRAVHTPGHASNHLCYFHEALAWLFTGDHIMQGSTVVIDPPDGNMRDYLRSLERLRELPISALAPGHGHLVECPNELIDGLIEHRLAREEKVIAALSEVNDNTLDELVRVVYADVDTTLHPVAERSLLAHLIKLESENHAVCNGDRWKRAR